MLIILLTLIFTRPFISSAAFEYINTVYSCIFLIFSLIWLYFYGKNALLNESAHVKYPLLLFISALAASILLQPGWISGVKEASKFITGALAFIVATSLTPRQKPRVINTILLAAAVISLLAIYQYFFGFRHVLNYLRQQNINDAFALEYLTRKRVYFPFITPNILAGYLAMVIPLALACKNKILLAIPLSLALLLTRSIGALSCLFLGLAFFYNLQKKLKVTAPFFLCGLLIIGFIFALRSLTAIPHLQPAFSSIMRLNYWKEALNIISAHPLIGVGPGNFNITHSRYAHNSYLQLWAETGILGLASFLWLIGAGIKQGLKNIRKSSDKTRSMALLSANVVFLTHNLVDFTFFLPEASLIWWVIFGLLISPREN